MRDHLINTLLMSLILLGDAYFGGPFSSKLRSKLQTNQVTQELQTVPNQARRGFLTITDLRLRPQRSQTHSPN